MVAAGHGDNMGRKIDFSTADVVKLKDGSTMTFDFQWQSTAASQSMVKFSSAESRDIAMKIMAKCGQAKSFDSEGSYYIYLNYWLVDNGEIRQAMYKELLANLT